MSRRWLRLDAQWDDTEWVMLLEPLAQLAWIKLLCYVKRDGRRGTAHALSSKAAAKKWGVTVRAVEDMIFQARQDGALVVEGEKWVLTKWIEYQEPDPTNAERQRLFRERNGSNGVTERYPVARDHRPPTRDHQTAEQPPAKVAKKRKTQLADDWAPLDRHRAKAKELGVNCDREVEKFRGYHGSHGNVRLDWNKSFDTWLLHALEYSGQRRPSEAATDAILAKDADGWLERKRATDEAIARDLAKRTSAPPTANEPSGPLAGVVGRIVSGATEPRRSA